MTALSKRPGALFAQVRIVEKQDPALRIKNAANTESAAWLKSARTMENSTYASYVTQLASYLQNRVKEGGAPVIKARHDYIAKVITALQTIDATPTPDIFDQLRTLLDHRTVSEFKGFQSQRLFDILENMRTTLLPVKEQDLAKAI